MRERERERERANIQMASITFKGRPTVVLRTYQVLRIGNNEHDQNLDFSLNDKVGYTATTFPHNCLSPSVSLSPTVCCQTACNADALREGSVSGQ